MSPLRTETRPFEAAPPRVARDLSDLPTYGFGPKSPMWWGTLGFFIIEGMAFALALATYFYLVQQNAQWPLAPVPPDHWVGTLNTALLLASLWPNFVADRDAHREDLTRVRRDLVIMSLIALVTVALRLYEFAGLGVRWDQNAYGSITWVLLALHLTHLITDAGDTLVLTALMFTRHAKGSAKGKRFSDVSDNAFYWYFVVGSWLPIYLTVYWLPRW
ncbi:cytochrome c oxidase subunit 3 [Methylorubrum extorquens]|uniref:cytochrome c oxidase subunit 3 n=1 Tax=Methylorubrum extorquens TaxID=408 RepID=UPI000158F328|nr:cytochrome c oxidase subunit 3 [Methylorubrum extorquens]ABY28522.1 putative cytochrome c oxidase subunit III protein [Methylorubrum extorquens PA1]KQP95403.1 cytochrome C oxidase subunit III [Methylobacterium sp. Leaf119]WIU39914.1 cytochrome c oxidase subunit 3 [Methylorubrum extorquens]WIU39977.1 cytochrome c oxidase subunit 3 [Methylorubrum extorquens]